jgi:signal transduction histidine kinase
MKSSWIPPKVPIRALKQPPRADAGPCAVSSAQLLPIQQALREVIAIQMGEHPPEKVKTAQHVALQTWIDLLNRSLPPGSSPFTLRDLIRKGRLYSVEFMMLANKYAAALADSDAFFEERVRYQIAGPLLRIASPLELERIYSLWPRFSFSDAFSTDLRITNVRPGMACVQWDPRPELECLPEEAHELYIQMQSTLYKTIGRLLPEICKQKNRATVEEDVSPLKGSAPYFQWVFRWELDPAVFPLSALIGATITLLLILLSFAWPVVRWVALIPVTVGATWSLIRQYQRQIEIKEIAVEQQSIEAGRQYDGARDVAAKLETTSAQLEITNEMLRRQVRDLSILQDVTLKLGNILDSKRLMDELINVMTDEIGFDSALLLVADPETKNLRVGQSSHLPEDAETRQRMENLMLPLDSAPDSLVAQWKQANIVEVQSPDEAADKQARWAVEVMGMERFLSVPLRIGERLTGVLLVDNRFSGRPFDEEEKRLLTTLASSIAITMQNARLYSMTDEALGTRLQELRIMDQIDRELNANLSFSRIMTFLIDWALRFTNATSSNVMLYHPESQKLEMMATYGYDDGEDEIPDEGQTLPASGVMSDVAQSGTPVILTGKDSALPMEDALVSGVRSQLTTPIVLEDRVLGLLNLQSHYEDVFTEEHLKFVTRLTDRAAVAIENARLFEEARREREKLSAVLASTADAVIVIDLSGRILLVNRAMRAAFNLKDSVNYTGQFVAQVFKETPLVDLYERAVKANETLFEEFEFGQEKTYYASISAVHDVGWVIVMQDISYLKEVDRLKNDLITTVSHDLKNPLNVLVGYLELIDMQTSADERVNYYLSMIRRSIDFMRQLIDDLLDMARIESGIRLNLVACEPEMMINDAIQSMRHLAEEKEMTVKACLEKDDLPLAWADAGRLRQILHNLLSNAIKYTAYGGTICVRAEAREGFIFFSVEDNGVGIAQENLDHIFSKFFRVRQPQTEAIEGTGLGLAIVKSLVEAHGGEIMVESVLNKGSTFTFSIPQYSSAHVDLPQALPSTVN